ncbi:MAG: hypothetical protein AAGJ35_09255 [Myxococcota bacterium]
MTKRLHTWFGAQSKSDLQLQGFALHLPDCFTEIPASEARHALLYVLSSHPHTGWYTVGHAVGFALHTPPRSSAPHCEPKSQ